MPSEARMRQHKLERLDIGLPPGGMPSVAPTRHRVTCGSKPGVGEIFSCFDPFLSHDIRP